MPRGMNGLEDAYAQVLEARRRRGEISSWAYEATRFILSAAKIGGRGRGSSYKPDFLVTLLDGRHEFHECKGFRRQAGIVRLKVAAALYPQFGWFFVTRAKGSWKVEEVKA